MNTISYVVLAMLIRSPLTGYELKRFLNLFWEAHHSQIYPTLKELRKQELIEIIDIPDGKRKIYDITPAGKELVKEWVFTKSHAPSQKDEFLAKVFTISALDRDTSKFLIMERKQYFHEQVNDYSKVLASLDELDAEERRKNFGRELILERKIRLSKEELAWCDWAEEKIEAYFAK
ncbi:MAG: PadR family transcriptional regulator [Enterococcus sp.]|uniref:PadR family transcriptional regulator n=1 Tax=unclassified Enterococcus TaxID=2608891 RepID=UPI000A34BB94|nr:MULTISPECIES: PadR family transcriptional regulator [unclassified Enterococcus]MDN6004722.1 PadR family transcriptional regulator [Enterococcus sp.]MDN6217232.1 PadR family transcriptional regulator [Enterococcus sp.]MDN6562172.1 PadR family transcriptional regulator [Enterococcus sp.]MDN6584065.1 PadR family transcriptional regulator [Enterococcus sp.]MDN6650341.1 PadR family transcriptional regulator [Enterococcus sp.]